MSSNSELSYAGNPSGKDILGAKAQKIIEDYQAHTVAEANLCEDLVKGIETWASNTIKTIKEASYQKQVMLHEKMQDLMNQINIGLAETEKEEDELRKFSDALHQFTMDVQAPTRDLSARK